MLLKIQDSSRAKEIRSYKHVVSYTALLGTFYEASGESGRQVGRYLVVLWDQGRSRIHLSDTVFDLPTGHTQKRATNEPVISVLDYS